METRQLIDDAFRLISTIPVSGNHVEVMAQAKARLRAAYKRLEGHEAQKTQGETGETHGEV